MKNVLLLLVFLFTCHWQALHSQIIAGSGAIGIRVDTPNIYQAQVANATALQQLYFNCDTTNNVNLYLESVQYQTSAGGSWRSSSFLIPLDSTIEFAKGIIGYSDIGNIFSPVFGAWRTTAGTVISDTLNVVWSTEDSLLFNKNVSAPLLAEYWNTNFSMKYIPLRKKYGNEYLYGWMLASAGTAPNSWPTPGNFIYQITKFPQLKVLYDTVSCGSSYTFLDGFTLNNILHDTVHDFVIPSIINGCDSLVRTKLTIPPTYLSTIYDTVCSGLSYSFPDGSMVNNLIHDTLHTSVFSIFNGCDSIIISNVHVWHDTTFETVPLCYGNSYNFPDGNTYTNLTWNLLHTSMLNNVNGCDSIIRTQILIIPPGSTTNLTACGQYFFNNQLLSSSGVYFDTLTNVLGCDSLVTLNLSISTISLNLTATPNYVCNSGISTLTAVTNSYTPYCFPTVTQGGITNDYISNFQFNAPGINNSTNDGPGDYNYYFATNTNVNAGGSYSFSINGNNKTRGIWIDYNQDGDFLDSNELVYFNDTSSSYYNIPYTGNITIPVTALNGKTRLRIGCKWSSSGTLTPCSNPSYGEYEDYNITISGGVNSTVWSPSTFLNTTFGNTVNAVNINATTTYTVTATNGNGCLASSTITINVYNASIPTTLNDTICSNQLPYNWNSMIINSAGTYSDTMQNIFGCDSIITLNLTIHTSNNTALNQSSCNSFFFNNQTLTSSGVYYDTLVNSNGCDSLITLNLTIHNSSNTILNQSSCNSFFFNNQTLTSSGVYYDTLVNSNGCDSLITLNLTIHNSSNTILNQSSCNSFFFNNQTLTSSGVYLDTLVNSNGCDSIITLNLTINNFTGGTFNHTSCISYIFNNQTITSSGTYYDTLVNSNGCDSIIELHVVIIPVNSGVALLGGDSLLASATGATYQWLSCNPFTILAGETNQSFIATANGDYAVVVTQNGCTDTSSCFSVFSVGVNEAIRQHHLQIIPNPARDRIFISLAENFINASIKLYSLTGSLLLEKKNLNGNQVEVDISSLANGIYFVEMKDGEKINRVKVVKSKRD